jgi:1,2-phenylacetyl-CoA epoxidase PaaB subunit
MKEKSFLRTDLTNLAKSLQTNIKFFNKQSCLLAQDEDFANAAELAVFHQVQTRMHADIKEIAMLKCGDDELRRQVKVQIGIIKQCIKTTNKDIKEFRKQKQYFAALQHMHRRNALLEVQDELQACLDANK